ncbi:hypothetical protein A3D62_03165 [Candidatus Kaiserbacteria bacterium RIFCSPHIGHO2_02_FULL_49_11]|uniref:Uncharacterized protein n=1 Tax=Candidatus Kaiserbacteria bacterium RIFCSPHIGHO2_02_FULL_49_11 TaxID=1798489 RepID=A0A1F6D0Q7_9BACT|nr:MAG: hypothetical protein A3D62_03165 [Candidatus Kaiserbacteria bacterium RIFCSPHIGHO2_02_FULL_49_11]
MTKTTHNTQYLKKLKAESSKLKASAGFTLIEMLIVMAISVIIIGAIVGSLRYFYKSNAVALEQSFAIQSARKGVEQLVKQAREAAFSDEGSYPLISFSDDAFSFYSDIDEDIFVEKVRYFLDGTNFKRGIINSSGDPLSYTAAEDISIISDNVRNSAQSVAVFSYYNASGTPVVNAEDITDIAYIAMELIVDVSPSLGAKEFHLRSSVTPRNVRDNQ